MTMSWFESLSFEKLGCGYAAKYEKGSYFYFNEYTTKVGAYDWIKAGPIIVSLINLGHKNGKIWTGKN